jgi:benzoate-CoA ligase
MPEPFNATRYLVGRRVAAGDGGRVAVRAPSGSYTYVQLDEQVRRVAAGLDALGLRPEERVLLCMVDELALFTAILATMWLGAVAVPVSTMLTGDELAKLAADSRAPVLVGSHEFGDNLRRAAAQAPDLRRVVLTGHDLAGLPEDVMAYSWDGLMTLGSQSGRRTQPSTWDESPALWLYTSGTTGTPKAAMHRHADIRVVCETYGAQVLGIAPDDVCLSVAKLFFAYGIGNSMFFPLSVGAAAVLWPERPTPGGLAELAARERPTLFFGVPTFYAALLASDVDDSALGSVRQGVSAGEPLSARLYDGIRRRFGVEVLDGIGSTEALHIFLSNRAGRVRPASSGVPVPGYSVQLRDEHGAVITDPGVQGSLYVRGESIATGYWCRTTASRSVFQGEWMRTGDSYLRNDDGTYTCLGRTDDLLKAGGIWVSPAEVEERLLAHPDVAEAVVVGVRDVDGLDKPVACVVPASAAVIDPAALIDFCRAGLAAFKRPRHVIVLDELPKTATGKLQRFAVRATAEKALIDLDVHGGQAP